MAGHSLCTDYFVKAELQQGASISVVREAK